MKRIEFDKYELLMSYDPCSLFEHFEEVNLHGLNYYDCIFRENTTEDSYIAGMNNFIPNSNDRYVFINLSRCNTELETITLIYHELLHQSFYRYHYDVKLEEEIITWAENETKKIYQIVKNELQTNDSIKENQISQE